MRNTSAKPDVTIASCAGFPTLSPSNQCLADALSRQGARVTACSWNSSDQTPFKSADLVVLRQTWDYMDDPGGFAAWSLGLTRAGARVRNAPILAIWNNDKRTLPQLTEFGVRTPVTVALETDPLDHIAQLPTNWIVLKPAFGGGGFGVTRIEKAHFRSGYDDWRRQYPGRVWMAQEFLPEIRQGEWKLICFDGDVRLALHAQPHDRDWRVNNRFRPKITVAEAPPSAIDAARRVADQLKDEAVCFRVDGVIRDGAFLCTELELTDPDLFLHLGPASVAQDLATALLQSI